MSTTPNSRINGLPERYEIRRLDEDHHVWVRALVAYSFVFDSELVTRDPPPKGMTRIEQYWAFFAALDDDMRHKLQSKISFGVFDLEYDFQDQESRACGGRFRCDPNRPDTGMTREELFQAMDFPLVSVAPSSYLPNPAFAINAERLNAALNNFEALNLEIEKRATWTPPGKKILRRGGTVTRFDYARRGFSKALAHFVMREAALQGYDGMSVVITNPHLYRVWSNPPSPFQAITMCKFDSEFVEEINDDGTVHRVFGNAKTLMAKVYISLDGNCEDTGHA